MPVSARPEHFIFPPHASVYLGAHFTYEGSGYVITELKAPERSGQSVKIVVAERCPVVEVDPDSRLGSMATRQPLYAVADRTRTTTDHALDAAGYQETAEEIVPLAASRPGRLYEAFRREILRRFLRDGDLGEPWRPHPSFWQWPTQAAQPANIAGRRPQALSAPEHLFMLGNCGRMEAELRQIVDTNPTVREAWNEAKRAHLSETSAAELALICLARENEDLRRQLKGRAVLVPVVSEE